MRSMRHCFKAPAHGMEMDGTVERRGPVLARRAVMGMGDGDAGKAAQLLDQLDRRVVDQGGAIPQEISGRGPNQRRALPNREAGLGVDLEQVRLKLPPGVDMGRAQLVGGRPGLPGTRHVLPFVPACRPRSRRS